MRKDWILSDEEKTVKREKIERNRRLKQQARLIFQQQTDGFIHPNFQINTQITDVSFTNEFFIFPIRITFLEKNKLNDPSWDSNYTPSTIRADVLSQLD